jgi:hypothetical protein
MMLWSILRLICGENLCFYRIIGKVIYVYHIVFGAVDYPKLFRMKNYSFPYYKRKLWS